MGAHPTRLVRPPGEKPKYLPFRRLPSSFSLPQFVVQIFPIPSQKFLFSISSAYIQQKTNHPLFGRAFALKDG